MYGLSVDRSLPQSIARQLTGQLRELILGGKLAAGARLPPTRVLASELDIARNIVIQVYEQLIAEGYLIGQTGSGTYVVDLAQYGAVRTASVNGTAGGVPGRPAGEDVISFDAGAVDYRRFPRAAWVRALRDACLDMPDSGFAWCAPSGDEDLRRELSAYLCRAKDISCGPGQILITPGATGGADLLAWALRSGTNRVAMEDPCVHFIREAFRRNHYDVLPVPVDEQGMRTQMLAGISGISLIFVVPSHQFPTGRVLSVRRRLELLDYARRCGAYIVEDDYDSEFRYEGEPIQSLRHLDDERVIYLGSFSKIFSPTLRIGYMIAPSEVLDRVRARMESVNQTVPALLQRTLAAYIRSGQLERHIYRMKKCYARKRLHLIAELRKAFGASVRISGENAGMHLLAQFNTIALGGGFADILQGHGVEADCADEYALNKGQYADCLVLGYGGLDEAQLSEGVRRIKAALDEFAPGFIRPGA